MKLTTLLWPTPLTPVQMAAAVSALSDRALATLARRRPDCFHPAPATFSVLASRLATPASCARLLSTVNTPQSLVAQACVALSAAAPASPGSASVSASAASTTTPTRGTADDTGLPAAQGVPVAEFSAALASALHLDEQECRRAVEDLIDAALLLAPNGQQILGVATGALQVLGPHPLACGHVIGDVARPLPECLAAATPHSSQGTVWEQVTQELSTAARGLLEIFTWEHPVGTVRAGGRVPGAQALIDAGLIEAEESADGTLRLAMPRQVSLALRGGQLLRSALSAPAACRAEEGDLAAVKAQAALHAWDAVRLVDRVVSYCDDHSLPVRRSGGVGVRPLGALAQALEVPVERAATALECAARCGLLSTSSDGTSWVPSREAEEWRQLPRVEQWAELVAAWLESPRATWRIGQHDASGTVVGALSDEVSGHRAAHTRRRLLAAHRSLAPGVGIDVDSATELLTWLQPHDELPEGACERICEEWEWLGVTGGDALIGVLRDGQASVTQLAQALADSLPDFTDTLLIQSDLSLICPGLPSPELGEFIDNVADVESRGAATMARLSSDSFRRALDAGYTAEQIDSRLAQASPTPLPSSVTTLLTDVARHHGAIRVRAVHSLLRVPDPALATQLLNDPAFAAAELNEVAPGILTSAWSAHELMRTLRAASLAPVVESGDGTTILGSRELDRLPRTAPVIPGGDEEMRSQSSRSEVEIAHLVAVLRSRQAQAARGGEAQWGSDPEEVLAQARRAHAEGQRMLLTTVSADGTTMERRVRIRAVEPGRLRVVDDERETELTVALHRIVRLVRDMPTLAP